MSLSKMNSGALFDATYLRSILFYDRETGDFKWLINKGSAKAGDEAGCRTTGGYLSIKINGKLYLCHRLAWLFEYGEFPTSPIDHRNGMRDKNCISNLRVANAVQNQQNVKVCVRNKTGAKNVTFDKARRKWLVQCKFNGINKYVGRYESYEAACQAQDAFAKAAHGDFYRRAILPAEQPETVTNEETAKA